MTKPKYNIGEKVYTIFDNNIVHCPIVGVNLHKKEGLIYSIMLGDGDESGYLMADRDESKIYPTPQSIIEHLL